MGAQAHRATRSARPQDVQQSWHVVDASDQVLGRLSTRVAMILRGKHRALFTPHADLGDFVIVINAEKVKFTGNKTKQKTYYKHSGHPGGISGTTAEKVLEGRFPERVMEKAVERMIPKGPLGFAQMRALHVFAGTEHPYAGQNPVALDVASMNRKNKVGA